MAEGHVRRQVLIPSLSPFLVGRVSGGGRGGEARTPDLRFWRPPLYRLSYAPSTMPLYAELTAFPRYLVSLCKVYLRHRQQNFLSSSRSGSFFLFLVVV